MTKKRTALAMAATIASGLLIGGCGGGEETSSPTTVSEADLQQNVDYWSSLDDGLKRELAGICQSEQVRDAETPQATLVIQDLDTDDYVAKIDAFYAESNLGGVTIDEACEGAKQEILSENVDELLSK